MYIINRHSTKVDMLKAQLLINKPSPGKKEMKSRKKTHKAIDLEKKRSQALYSTVTYRYDPN